MSNWETISLGQHCRIRTGKKDVNEGSPYGMFPFFTCSRNISWSESYSFDTEAVLIAGNGDVGNLHYYKGKFEAYQRTYVLDSFDKNINYIYQFLEGNLLKALQVDKVGTSIPYIKLNHLNDFQIYIPKCDYHQEKIATILQKIDQTIEKTEALIEKYQQIKAGLMHDLFTRGVTADGKLRPTREQAPELYQETPIGWIPKDWEIKTVSELANQSKGSTVIGPFGSDLVMSDYRTEGTPVVFVRDVKEDKFHWVSNVFVSSKKAQALFAHRVKPGDILATKMGLPPCVAAVYPEDMPMGIITADMIRMTPDISKVDPNWLSAALNYDRTKRQVAAITAGVTRPKVTLSDFRSLRLAVPKPEEQKVLVKIFTANLQVLHSEEAKSEKLKKQKKGLMLDLLTGKVTVIAEDPEATHV